jgi:hypothetical protein
MSPESPAREIESSDGGLIRPTSRRRLAILMGVNLLGFLVVNCFWHYLSTARWFTGSGAFWGDMKAPLGEMFVRPLSIFHYPWMIPVTGLLLAVIMFTPILVAMLYRLPFSLMFLAVTLFVGCAPLLTLSLLVGCVLASKTTLRRNWSFLAMLLGLVPPALYLYLYVFDFAGLETIAVVPLQRWILATPLLISILLAVFAGAAVLDLAKLTGYRPGVIWPVLLVLLAAPLTIFYIQIGPAELQYALIADRLSPGDRLMETVAVKDWVRHNHLSGLNEEQLALRARQDIRQYAEGLLRSCRRFLAAHPEHPRAAEVLWIQAQCDSAQLDEPAFRGGLLRCSVAFPLVKSQEDWRQLCEEYPTSPQSGIACWKLAELTLRRKSPTSVAEAQRRLVTAVERFDRRLSSLPAATEADGVFSPPPSLPEREYYQEAKFQAQRLQWLLEKNVASGDARAAAALGDCLDVNPCQADYADRLADLLNDRRKNYEQSAFGDNLKLAVAMAARDEKTRARMLLHLAKEERSDAAVEATYELGQLVMRHPLLRLMNDIRTPEEYFKLVIAAPPNPYQPQALERLKWLGNASRPAVQPGN